jgi:hypothetical protein
MAIKILGKTISPPMAVAIAGGSGLAIWFAVKHKKSSSSSSPSAIDPVTGLPYSQDSQIDPLTGQSYLAEAQEYGSVQAAENAVAGQSSIDYSSAYGSGGYGPVGTSAAPLVPSTTVQGTTYASNAAWAQAVEAGLTDIGYSSTDIAAALGRYLGGLSLTSTQATIVQAAIAEYGPPPVGTYQVILAPVTGPTGSGDGSGSSGGQSGGGSSGSGSGSGSGGPITVAPSGFRVAQVNGLAVTLAWDPLTPPAGEGPVRSYVVAYGQSPGSTPYQQAVVRTATSTTIRFSEGPGAHGLTHYFTLWADPASPGGPHAGPISATTQ